MKSRFATTAFMLVGIAAIGFLAYSIGTTPTTSADSSSNGSTLVSVNTGSPVGPGASVSANAAADPGAQVVQLLRSLSSITLDDSVLQNPGFAMLQDLSVQLPPALNPGRINPFAPVNGQ